jgi:polysaccharide deacetylase family protein (PEP-CTERM system associated)
MVRRIVADGHELASHGYGHERASTLEADAFFADVALAKAVLEDIGGTRVQGYRAPSFSIGEQNRWAYACLARAGYRYSSSVYPIQHDHYGSPNGARFAHMAHASVLEVPIATARLFRTNLPAGGGGYFRLMPYALSRWLLRRVNLCDEESAIFYFHPWEIDPEQPRVNGVDAKTRFRHYVNLERTASRLRLLLQDFRWDRMDRVVFGVA